ncbi:TetR/AcrR family transcriptional regulator [Alkalicoccobacillus murimartini]|uniref:AcrR family transcriptional regulator n=1 Tax=Alkalicoccobacillus murimartini TaxID=171685 RepID=A0ABT9YL67_9BACI|nr:TetR/AcrR family transcriptional regulator [Alkalicoccobacillus murimartini]MDQ0208607.1 AcrR family transcriptional regulator [Alkalicoccobacillus murimartini]
MKANEIKKSAIVQFVNKGYEETSLDDIVEGIGIKKQSIYSHFKNKEDIFLQVMNDAVNKEISFVNHFFESRSQAELQEVLFKLLVRYKERYLLEDDKNIKFLLRMAFMPPYHLRDTAMEQFEKYNQELERNVKEAFSKAEHIRVTAEEGTISFLNFLDGILVELIYTNSSKFETRLRVSWEIYWQGISMIK